MGEASPAASPPRDVPRVTGRERLADPPTLCDAWTTWLTVWLVCRLIAQHVDCLADLAGLPLERLEAIMGAQRPARMLFDFLHAPCPRAGL